MAERSSGMTSPSFCTSSSDRVYITAIGSELEFGGSISQNLRFPGQVSDTETGFYYNLYRDYMPNLGRYLESDPIGLAGGSNTYTYVAANPLRYTDRHGTASPYSEVVGQLAEEFLTEGAENEEGNKLEQCGVPEPYNDVAASGAVEFAVSLDAAGVVTAASLTAASGAGFIGAALSYTAVELSKFPAALQNYLNQLDAGFIQGGLEQDEEFGNP